MTEGNEVIYGLSAELNPENPIVSHSAGIEHTIFLRKTQDQWKIISDTYDDDLWRMLRHAGKSTDEILRTADEMLGILEAAPSSPMLRMSTVEASPAYAIPEDPSSHPYDRTGAVDYALRHWNYTAGQYNPNYPRYSRDCQNFVSQSVYEGGNVSMYIPDPLPGPSDDGQIGWYLLNDTQRATAWNDVESFYAYVTEYLGDDAYGEGPVGILLGTLRPEDDDLINDVPAGLMLGDVIQYEWLGTPENPDPNGPLYDHSAIVVAIEGGVPYVAAHTIDHDRDPYTTLTPIEEVRFIHIERSNGYPPVKVEVKASSDDAGTFSLLPGSCAFSSTANEIYFGTCPNGNAITSGFRFTDVQIPRDAQIKYAYVTFTVDGTFTDIVNVHIYGEDSGNAAPFTAMSPPESRALINPLPIQWDITDTWTWKYKRTPPAITSIIQSIVTNRDDWEYGNSLSLIFKNNGTNVRRVMAIDRVMGTNGPPDIDLWNYWTARLVAAYTLDGAGLTAPTVYSVTRDSASPTNASSAGFTVTFSEPVIGVDASDFFVTQTGSISDATVSGITGSSDTYTVMVNTGSGDGKIRLDVVDNGSIQSEADAEPLYSGFAAGEAYTIDRTTPTVLSIALASANPTTAASVDFEVVFYEIVTGVDTNDFSLDTDITGASVTNVTRVHGAKYRVSINTGSGDGTIRLRVIDNDTIVDLASNSLGAEFISEPYTIDRIVPTVSSSARASANPTNLTSVDFAVSFPESVTGVDPSDFVLAASGISGAAVSGVSGSGSTYTVTVNTGTGDGTLRLDVIDNDSIVDAVSNPLGGPGLGNGDFSVGEAYAVYKTVLFPPTLLTPADISAHNLLRPVFDWENVPEATQYTIQASRYTSFSPMVINTTVTPSTYTPASNLPVNTLLYWRVKGVGPKPGTWSDVWEFTTGNPPSIPTLSAPANNALVSAAPLTFDWSNSTVPSGTTFDHYQIQIAADSNFTSLVHDNNLAGVTNSQDDTAVLSPGATYYWRVRSANTVGDFSGWPTTARSVRIKYAPPILYLPANGSTIYTFRPTFDWNDTNGATNYTLQVSPDGRAFSTLIVNQTVTASTYTQPTDLSGGNPLYWRVRANGTYGPGDWSSTFAFCLHNDDWFSMAMMCLP